MRTWDPFRFDDFAGHTELPYFRFWACNISVKRDFILQHGPFREAMGRAGPAAHEDPELGYRLHPHGLRIFYCPEALGHHHHVVTLQQACARAHHQGLNFGEFNTLVPEPEIPVVYHVIGLHTVRDHLRTWFGPGRRHLAAGDRNPVLLLARYLVRDLVFNGVTVRRFWEPLFERAERDPRVARRMRPAFYRGLIAYYFFRGCREGNERFGAPQLQRA
jgi:hypothetical protein